jgi:eukaryotic-like serine/threonine-protein kinase
LRLAASGAENIAPSARQSGVPPSVPDHELLRSIGIGSYGEVWLARSAIGSLRAVKVVYRDSFDHDRPYEREFEGLKKFEPLSHARESQVDIFHVGRNDAAGFFYYIMELADAVENPKPECQNPKEARNPNEQTDTAKETLRASGFGLPSSFDIRYSEFYTPHTLKHDLRTRGALPVSECVQIALSLTRALEHLHAHGLVHRDIKPSNIIFVKGVPKLADIGLVTSVDATRSFVGTDGYIPPEGPGAPAGDLYSLGKVLYEAITGKDRLDFPELPADWRTRPDFDQLLEFNEILTKACEKDTQQRYKTAEQMRCEIGQIAEGKSVRRKRTIVQRLTAAKRFGMAAAVVALVILLVPYLAPRTSTDTSPRGTRILSQNAEAQRLYELARWITLASNRGGSVTVRNCFTGTPVNSWTAPEGHSIRTRSTLVASPRPKCARKSFWEV